MTATKIKSDTTQPTITLTRSYFEHLLACLANQKFVGEAPPCGDAMAMQPGEYLAAQRLMQKTIDDAWLTGMDMLHGARQ